MTLIVKQDEASDPLHVGIFGSNALAPGANDQAHLLQKFWFATILVKTADVKHYLTLRGRQAGVPLMLRNCPPLRYEHAMLPLWSGMEDQMSRIFPYAISLSLAPRYRWKANLSIRFSRQFRGVRLDD
jgi:hypothetical protein